MPDDARLVAHDPRAPADERRDAETELAKANRPLASDLIPSADIRAVINHIQADLEDQALLKARGQVIPFPGAAGKARGMQSVYLDDQQVQVQGDWFDKGSLLDFDGLRSIVDRTPILSAIVLTRIRQISRFCGPSEDGGPGFEIRHVDRTHKLQADESESAKLLTQFFQHSGWEPNPRKRRLLKRDSFPHLMAKLIRDSLVMDSCPIETEMKRNAALGIDGIYAVDGSTIRLCTEHGYEGDDDIFALQVVQGRVRTTYTRDQLIYEPRNPRSDVRLAGYGLSETELLVQVVTGFLNAMSYNIAGFDNNSIPKGLLHLSGDYADEDLSAFRRYWNMMVKGVNKAWTLPIMVSKDQESKASFEKIGVEFNEMYFGKWMTFLTSICCAVYGMGPDEINFDSFTGGNTSSLSGSDTEEKLGSSKEKGLQPLMSYFEGLFSDYVVSAFSDKFVFRWCGLEEEDDDRIWEAKKLILTVDELRAEQGYEKHPDPILGTAPLNPTLVGAWQQQAMPQPEPQQPEGGQEPQFGEVKADDGQGAQPGAGDATNEPDTGDAGDNGDKGDQAARQPEFGGAKQEGDFGKALPTIWSLAP